MAALTINAADVLLVSGTPYADQQAGEGFSAGNSVYKADNGTWLKAQVDGTAIEAGANDLGIALGTANAAGARVSIAGEGCVVNIGTGSAGVVYVPGTTAGGVMPIGDLASTNKATVLGVGIGSNKIKIDRMYDAGAVVA